MAEGETLSFSALSDLTSSVADGGAVRLTVNGVIRRSREPGQPWSDSFRFDDERRERRRRP